MTHYGLLSLSMYNEPIAYRFIYHEFAATANAAFTTRGGGGRFGFE
jgi:hypothetical protein